MNDDELWNEYLIEGTNVVKNNLNIQNIEELKKAEKMLTRKSLAHLYLEPVTGNFDFEHLKEIHIRIFKDIYPFAGEIRKCTLQKDDHIFCNPDQIEPLINDVLNRMNEDFKNEIYSKQEFAYKLAKYYYELIYVHPFREGNGRAIRVFIRDFVVQNSKDKFCGSFDLDYTKIDGENLLLGTAQRYIYPSFIEIEFMKGLVHKENNKIMK